MSTRTPNSAVSQSTARGAPVRRGDAPRFFATVTADAIGLTIIVGDALIRPPFGSHLSPEACVLVQRLRGGLVYGVAKEPNQAPGAWDEIWIGCDSGPSTPLDAKAESFRRCWNVARDDVRLAIYQSKIAGGMSINQAAVYHPSGKEQPDVRYRGPTTIEGPITTNEHARGAHPVRAGAATEFWAPYVGAAPTPSARDRSAAAVQAEEEAAIRLERPRQR